MSPDQQFNIVVAVTVLLVAIWMILRVRRFFRRRRPARIHPNLQKYQPAEDLADMRRNEADKIVATSSAGEIVGYRIERQIEAVFVDGFRKPEEAVEGLKAVAAMKGANAVIHVRHTPEGMGRYSASGDAVVVQDLSPGASVRDSDQAD